MAKQPKKNRRPDNAFESYAKACIEAELGLQVVKHDDNSQPGMHDLEIIFEDGIRGAVEVTTNTDGKSTKLWKLVTEGDAWIEPDLVGGWTVDLKRDPRLPSNWKTRIRKLVHNLERLRFTSTSGTEFQKETEAIGAVEIKQGPTAKPGSVYVWPNLSMGGGVAENADPVVDWLKDWVTAPIRRDNLDKLARSGYSQRHLFIGFPGFAEAPFPAVYAMMTDGIGLPTKPPELPKEVTDIWVVSSWSAGEGLRWSASTGWKFFDKLTRAS